MIATMKVTMLYLAVVLLSWCSAAPDKLKLDTKAPLHARSSSAARALSGLTPANVGRLPQQPKPQAPSSGGQPQQDDVQREETVSFKEVNGETVRSVVGNYGYQSPEGLPVSFKYMADENGNQASFTIGAAAGGSGSKSRPGGGTGGSQRPGTAGAGKTGAGAGKGGAGGGAGKAGAGGGAGTKGNQSGKNAIGGDGDRKYLPPT